MRIERRVYPAPDRVLEWRSQEHRFECQQHLNHRRMGEIAVSQINVRGWVAGQMPNQHFRILTGTGVLEYDRPVRRCQNGHCSTSAISSTSKTRPSPSTVVPAIPGVPDKSPSRAFQMTYMRS